MMESVDGIATVRRMVCEGERSAQSIVRTALQRMESLEPSIHAMHEVYGERALDVARSIDERRADGASDLGTLAGVPIILKDNMATQFGTTSAGSRLLEGYQSPFDATVVTRLEAADAIIIGKAHCDEFAMGSSNEHNPFAQPKNPWSLDHVPGGSSGGCAAAVSAGYCSAAIGSDTGGSIRQPAAFCGIVGVKPSYGRVSRWGLVAFGSSLDQMGPMARNVEDAAILLQVMAGADPRDSTCADRFVPDFASEVNESNASLRVGVPAECLSDDNDPDVNAAIRAAIEVYASHGAEIVDVPLTMTRHAVATYYVLATAEASSNLARYDGIRYGNRADSEKAESLDDVYVRSRSEGFGPEVQRRILLGTFVLSSGYYDAYYRRAQQVRRLIADEYAAAFDSCDVLLTPTAPSPAFRRGSKSRPIDMYLGDRYTIGANIAGICAASLPCGLVDREGVALPVGLQLQAAAFEELKLLRAARQYERWTEGARYQPPPDTLRI